MASHKNITTSPLLPMAPKGGSLGGLERPLTSETRLTTRRKPSTPVLAINKPLPPCPPRPTTSSSERTRWSSSSYSTLRDEVISYYFPKNDLSVTPHPEAQLRPTAGSTSKSTIQSPPCLKQSRTSGDCEQRGQHIVADSILSSRIPSNTRLGAARKSRTPQKRSTTAPVTAMCNTITPSMSHGGILSGKNQTPPLAASPQSVKTSPRSRVSPRQVWLEYAQLVEQTRFMSHENSSGVSILLNDGTAKSDLVPSPLRSTPYASSDKVINHPDAIRSIVDSELAAGGGPIRSTTSLLIEGTLRDRRHRKSQLHQSLHVATSMPSLLPADDEELLVSNFSDTSSEASPTTPTPHTPFYSWNKIAKKSLQRHKSSLELYQVKKPPDEHGSRDQTGKETGKGHKRLGSNSSQASWSVIDEMYETLTSMSPVHKLQSIVPGTIDTAYATLTSPKQKRRACSAEPAKDAPLSPQSVKHKPQSPELPPLPRSPAVVLSQRFLPDPSRFSSPEPVTREKAVSSHEVSEPAPRKLHKAPPTSSDKKAKSLPANTHLVIRPALRTRDLSEKPLPRSPFFPPSSPLWRAVRRTTNKKQSEESNADAQAQAQWREEIKKKIVVVPPRVAAGVTGAVSGNSLGTGSYGGFDDGANWLH